MSEKLERKNLMRANRRKSIRTGVPLDSTATAYLNSPDPALQEEGMYLLRRVIAILLIQYSAVLFIVSPFCLIESFQRAVKPFRILLGAGAFFGIVAAIVLVYMDDGSNRRYPRIATCLLTSCVAVSLGIKISLVAWANYVLVAIGQATTNFAILLAIVQFDRRQIYWLNSKSAGAVAFGISLVWMMVLVENETSWGTAAAVAMGGWLYYLNIVFGIRKAVQHRTPDDYVRAALFILGPNVPDFALEYIKQKCGGSKQSDADNEEIESESPNNYGGIGTVE